MKHLLKPWIMALSLAICLHGVLLLWFKDQSWAVIPNHSEKMRLQVSLLPNDKASADIPTNSDLSKVNQDEKVAPAVIKEANQTQTAPASEPVENDTKPIKETQTATAQSEPFSIDEIITATPEQNEPKQDWQHSKLLDIGPPVAESAPKVDPQKDAFSPAFRQALQEAKQLQKEYLKGVVKKTKYPITEDADGTKYVNIKGVCWKMPEPGSEEAWQIVLSGCSGQTDLIHFELNITTDILTPEQMQLLPFGGE